MINLNKAGLNEAGAKIIKFVPCKRVTLAGLFWRTRRRLTRIKITARFLFAWLWIAAAPVFAVEENMSNLAKSNDQGREPIKNSPQKTQLDSGTAKSADTGTTVIKAENGIEWNRSKFYYSANGKAQILQPGMTINADFVIANYKPKAKPSVSVNSTNTVNQPAKKRTNPNEDTVFTKIEAKGSVVIVRDGDHIVGDQAVVYSDSEGTVFTRIEAKGSVVFKRDGDRIEGDQATAYLDSKGTVFTKIEAKGSVVIMRDGNRIVGDQAMVYLDSVDAQVTGKHLRLTTARGEIITARDSIEYNGGTQLIIARGDAKAVRDDRQVKAQILTVQLQAVDNKHPNGELEFSRMNGFGDMIITNRDRIAAGDRGSYNLIKNLAVVMGNVRLAVGSSLLKGDYGEQDMANGNSRILSGSEATAAEARVRGIIRPQDLNKTLNEKTNAPLPSQKGIVFQ